MRDASDFYVGQELSGQFLSRSRNVWVEKCLGREMSTSGREMSPGREMSWSGNVGQEMGVEKCPIENWPDTETATQKQN